MVEELIKLYKMYKETVIVKACMNYNVIPNKISYIGKNSKFILNYENPTVVKQKTRTKKK